MELNRKRQLEALLSRSHEQIKEEELLFTELKRREAMNERFFEMRHFAERTYGKHELSHSIDRAQMQYYGQNANDPRLKKKQRPDVPGAGPVISIPQARAPSGSGLPSATPTTPSLEVPRRETKVVSGTNLRSGMTVQLKGQALQKVNEYLTELGIRGFLVVAVPFLSVHHLTPHISNPALQPTMPTAQIMRTFDELRTSVSTLLDWKKQEEVLENHVRVLRIRRDNMNALGMSPTSPMMDMSGLGKVGPSRDRVAKVYRTVRLFINPSPEVPKRKSGKS